VSGSSVAVEPHQIKEQQDEKQVESLGGGWLERALGLIVAIGAVTTTFAHDQGGAGIEWRGNRSGLAGVDRGAALATIAATLKITVSDLQSVLQAGKTVAALAMEKSVALQTIVDCELNAQAAI
jgi:hypothetical protein